MNCAMKRGPAVSDRGIALLPAIALLFWMSAGTVSGQQRMSIAEARQDANGDFIPDRLGKEVSVAGRANVGSGILHTYRLSVFIQDDSAAIELYSQAISRQIHEGDSVLATGIIGQYEGTTQLIVSSVTVVQTERRAPKPLRIVIPRRDMEKYEGRLISVEGHISGKKADMYGDYVTVQDIHPEGGTVNVFLSRQHIDTLSLRDLSIGDHVSVTGVLEQYAVRPPLNSNYEIYPRYPNDIAVVGLSLVFVDRLLVAGGILLVMVTIWLVVSRLQVRGRTNQLKESESRFKVIFDSSPDAITLFDPVTLEILDCNDKSCSMNGYVRHELIGRSIGIFLENEGLAALSLGIAQQFPQLDSGASPVLTIEGTHRRKDGSSILTESSISRMQLGGKQVLLSVDRDITERVKTENLRRASDDRFRSVWNNSPAGLRLTDRNGIIVDVNEAYCRLVRMQREELLGKVFSITYQSQGPSDDLSVYHKRFDSGEVMTGLAAPATLWDGETVDLEISSSLLETADGRRMFLAVFLDISERRRAERMLHLSLQEKSILLKEIHHRVKNNMQVISSLLSLQERRIVDEGLRNIFKDSQLRIRSMALVHEKLYQSDSLARIDFGEYVDSLAAQLFRSYGSHRVAWKREGGNVLLSADAAVPCGLIINELITNAMKHAFPDNREGMLVVSMRPLPDGRCELKVSDNGKGIPPDLNIKKTTSLGMQLIDSLVEQIDGTIEIHRENGTQIIITFCAGAEESDPGAEGSRFSEKDTPPSF